MAIRLTAATCPVVEQRRFIGSRVEDISLRCYGFDDDIIPQVQRLGGRYAVLRDEGIHKLTLDVPHRAVRGDDVLRRINLRGRRGEDDRLAGFAVMAMNGPVLEVGEGEQEETTVPDSDNNASLTIPNQPIPETPKTGVAMPAAAAVTLLCRLCAGAYRVQYFRVQKEKKDGK